MMVDLQNLKNAISTGPFSEDVKLEATRIIDAGIARGGEITVEEKQKVLNLIDLDIDRNDLDQSANEEIAEMLESFVADVDSAAQTATENIEASGENFNETPDLSAVQSKVAQPPMVEPQTVQQEQVAPLETPQPQEPQQ